MVLLLHKNCGLMILRYRAGKTLSKRASATFHSKGVCSSMYTGLFTYYGPPQYLSLFSSWMPKSKKNPFFTNFHFALVKVFVGLLQTQF